MIWSDQPSESGATQKAAGEFLTLIVHVGNSELKNTQTQEIEQMQFYQTAIFKSNLRNQISSLLGHVPSFLSSYRQ